MRLTEKLLLAIEKRADQPVANLDRPARRKMFNELIAASEQLNLGITPEEDAAAERWVKKNRMERTGDRVGAPSVYRSGLVMPLIDVMDTVSAVTRADLAGHSSAR